MQSFLSHLKTAKALHSTQLLAAIVLSATLTACGGGGGGGSTGPSGGSSSQNALPSDILADQCVAPRAGSSDRAGSIDTEKAWVRAYMDDTYLWYKDITPVNAANYTVAANGSVYKALDSYFDALLTTKRTASGKLVDQFSFTIPTADLTNLQSGVSSGYGIRFVFISNVPPRLLRVLYVENGSPAAIAGVLRGDTVTSIDGILINDNTTAGIATLNAGLNPTVASKTTVFGLQAPSGVTRTATVTSSQNITVNPVAMTRTFTVGTSTVGYLVLNSFSINSAENN